MTDRKSPLSDSIFAHASNYARIQATLSALQHIPSALSRQTSYIASLEAEITTKTELIATLSDKTKKEREDYERLRDSTALRLAYKLTGKKDKYAEKAEKEEKEYVDALQREMGERQRLEELQRALDLAKKEHEDIHIKMNEYVSLKSELWELYDSVFDGSQAPPRDCELRAEIASAERTHKHLSKEAVNEAQILKLLQAADTKMDLCRQKVQKTIELFNWDINGRSPMSDQMQQDNLKAAGKLADEVKLLVKEARRVCPDIKDFGGFSIPQGGMRMELPYHLPVFQAASKEAVIASGQQVDAAYHKLKGEVKSATQREKRSRLDLAEATEVVNECRTNLDVYRQGVFDAVLSAEIPPPPSYNK